MNARFLALTGALLALPLAASASDGYDVRFVVRKGDDVIASGTGHADPGAPFMSAFVSPVAVGDGRSLNAGYRFRLVPKFVAEGLWMAVEFDHTEIVDKVKGVAKDRAFSVEGDAVRSGGGWAYEADRLTHGMALSVTYVKASPATP